MTSQVSQAEVPKSSSQTKDYERKKTTVLASYTLVQLVLFTVLPIADT